MVRPDIGKRVGRPRLAWPHESLKELWQAFTKFRRTFRWETFNHNDPDHVYLLQVTMNNRGFRCWLAQGAFCPL
eukprot:12912760-Prorocentrum_lima.AAC.1